MKFFGSLILLIIIVCGLGYGYLSITYPTVSQQTSAYYFVEHILHPHARLTKQTIAFLPYWRIEDIPSARLDLLSEINYFGLTINQNGEFITLTNNQTDPGWREWQTQTIKDLIVKTHIMGGTFSVTIINHTNEKIEAFLENEKAQETFTQQIVKQITERKLDDVTIDFEYFGEPDAVYQEAFTTFIAKLDAKLENNAPQTTLTIAIMPRAARDPDLYDFPKLVSHVDRFIGMSYDYYGASADIAGPGAPINGYKEKEYFFDVTTTYEDYLKVIPKEKLVMGIPYYGWDRAVENGQEKNSKTLPLDDPNNYAGVISYGRLREEKKIKPSQCQWDDIAQETWCWYTDAESGIDHQAWLADERSIGARYDFAKDYGLAGIAIWVLGYDKHYPELWELMQKKLKE